MTAMKKKLPCFIQISSNIYIHWLNVKVLFTLSILSIFTYSYIFCSQLRTDEYKELQEEALRYCTEDVRYAEMFRKKEKLQKNVKFVLLWTDKKWYPFPNFADKQRAFIRNNCPYINCYVTDDRDFFEGELKRFDAILFNGRVLKYSANDLPKKRYNHQKYIYVNLESAANYPVCNKIYDNFFNWTYTYRLDSDLLYTYFNIKDINDDVVGPKPVMHWKYGTKVDDVIEMIWKRKRKAAAWMVSNCETQNKREELGEKLFHQMFKSNLTLDVFGACETQDCPKRNMSLCWELIKKEYYFYFSFENANSVDYVTEKVLYPLHYFTIPIVFGGANYSRFMPPFSYLDASKLSVKRLVSKMIKIINSKKLFMEYFKWRSVYKYVSAERSSICSLCSALHNKEVMTTHKSYKYFRKWWNPNYIKDCESLFSSMTYGLFRSIL